jgi:hypothetical protein
MAQGRRHNSYIFQINHLGKSDLDGWRSVLLAGQNPQLHLYGLYKGVHPQDPWEIRRAHREILLM